MVGGLGRADQAAKALLPCRGGGFWKTVTEQRKCRLVPVYTSPVTSRTPTRAL